MKKASLFVLATAVSFPAWGDAGQFFPVPYPIRPGILSPATSSDGQTVVLASAVTPAGAATDTANLYVNVRSPGGDSLRQLTDFSGMTVPFGATAVSLSADGRNAAYTLAPHGPGQGEEVHLIDTLTGKDQTVAVDKEGCVMPMVGCVACFFTCLRTPHVSADGSKVLYAAGGQQPFYVVDTGSGAATHLPVYYGGLAPGPQRVMSRSGLLVFTSSAPSGPTFAASATDVYTVNLDGTGLKNLTRFGINPMIYSRNAVISDDGATVVFESNNDPSTRGAGRTVQIYAVDSGGSQLRALTADASDSTSPSLSADGLHVVFLQGGQAYVVDTSGRGRKAALTDFRQSAAQDAVMSGDGTVVILLIGPANGGGGAVYEVVTASGSPGPLFAPTSLNSGGVVGAAQSEPPSAGSLMNVYGINLGADSLTVAQGFPLPTELGGISLLVNGQAVPLLAVTPWQITAQLAQTTPEGQATFSALKPGGEAVPSVTAEVKSAAPAVFVYLVASEGDPVPVDTGVVGPPHTGYWQAAAYHAGTALPADLAHPAEAGEVLEIYGSGLGKTEPMVAAGAASPQSPPARSVFVPNVIIGDRPATVSFAGLVPGLAGIYQVNAIVPQGLSPGLQGVGWLNGDAGYIAGLIAVK